MSTLDSSGISNQNASLPTARRLFSLDALRGFDMFWIISGEGIFHGLASVVMKKHNLFQNPENWMIGRTADLSFFEHLAIIISNQLHHSVWNGFTFYDMIFPLFIFISGVSMPFSYRKFFNETNQELKKQAKKQLYLSLIKRTITLIILGMVVNGLLKWQGFENTRFASVLGRIALSTFFAAVIYLNFSLSKQIYWVISILAGYFLIMKFIPVPGFGAGVFTPKGNLSAFIDQHFLPGKLHRIFYDPEGLLSTIPAIASAFLGIFTGQFLMANELNVNPAKKSLVLLLAGMVSLALGLSWNIWFPINKNMWTSSFVLYAGGWSIILFAVFYYLIDALNFSKWTKPFIWIGTNSILIYMAAHGLVNFESTSQFLFGGLINMANPNWHQPLLWISVLLIQLALLKFLFDKKWFLKV